MTTVICRVLISLDTAKICKESLKIYKHRKKVLERLDAQLQQYEETDEPEYQKILAKTFGAEQTLLNELVEKLQLCHSRYDKISYLAREKHIPPVRCCFLMQEKVTDTIDIWAVLESELHALEESSNEKERQRKEEIRILLIMHYRLDILSLLNRFTTIFPTFLINFTCIFNLKEYI